VSLARALDIEPETLLLDEPLSNLDANLREEMRFEVRRLHDAFHYTTVYVTHDQSEAMTTADLIAVMNGGRIEQLGSPEEIYQRPVSEFVARFIGGSNVLRGKALDGSHIQIAGRTLACTGHEMSAGKDFAVSIRQHAITLMTEAPKDEANVLPGVVERHVYLGATRDYLLRMDDGGEMRVTAPAAQRIEEGAKVWAVFARDECRALKS
jgi:iron(III) transport system ATP-binding protein